MTFFSRDYGYQAYRILQLAFVVIPIVAGLDKFFYFLADWPKYLAPQATQTLQGHERTFMALVGIIEIIAGIGVLLKPRIFSYIVALWLLLIIVNLILTGQYYDIAARDLGLMLGALALGRLSHKYEIE